MGHLFDVSCVDPAWLIPAVTTLARIIFERQAFDEMPDLADELELAGYKNEEIPLHCPPAGDHVRGCWVLDVIGQGRSKGDTIPLPTIQFLL